ncbi:hypothetical protein EVAR_43405_1 [Eumeta japonica]|uniref:Uncharacterized protein n=1 Tax=Eumeta variegata TaxID=151549 RepID=A0A4C1WUG7_EUMVA|nr:hypothetical protein EVAR_43405_1 [Eumeta japonica]
MRWGERDKFKFAPQKTKATLFTRKLKCDLPIVRLAGKQIELVNELKLAYAAKVTWELNQEIIRTTYVAVIEPIVLYAASAWSLTEVFLMNRKRQETLQRGFAQKICKSYRTISLNGISALVLSGLLCHSIQI